MVLDGALHDALFLVEIVGMLGVLDVLLLVEPHEVELLFVLLHELGEVLQVVLELARLALRLRLEVLDLVVRLVSLLVGGVGRLDHVRHLLALLVQVALELFVEAGGLTKEKRRTYRR